MIATLLKISWLNLKRDYVALGLTYVLPIVFFSIFAVIFGGTRSGSGSNGSGAKALHVVLVDEDNTDLSRRFLNAIQEQKALDAVTSRQTDNGAQNTVAYSRDEARKLVRQGECDAAVVIPSGWSETFGNFAVAGKPVEVIFDSANPMAEPTVNGLLQASAMTAAPDILMKQGLGFLDAVPGGGLTDDQRHAFDAITPFLRGERPWSEYEPEKGENQAKDAAKPNKAGDRDDDNNGPDNSNAGLRGLVAVQSTPARLQDGDGEDEQKKPSMVAYYAAGIGVMFLLFSMAGAGGSLLDEEDSGTLGRLLSSRVSMQALLFANWLFFAILGLAQVTLMFVWGALVFDLELWTANRLIGFFVMSIVTAAAAAGFGILLATLCKSRAQLSGFSTIIILIMSALGGSMVPRFIMPKFMETTAMFTFNGWALDGYLKVFWYDDPDATLFQSLIRLLPQLAVLTGLTIVFLLVARLFARRWETA